MLILIGSLLLTVLFTAEGCKDCMCGISSNIAHYDKFNQNRVLLSSSKYIVLIITDTWWNRKWIKTLAVCCKNDKKQCNNLYSFNCWKSMDTFGCTLFRRRRCSYQYVFNLEFLKKNLPFACDPPKTFLSQRHCALWLSLTQNTKRVPSVQKETMFLNC